MKIQKLNDTGNLYFTDRNKAFYTRIHIYANRIKTDDSRLELICWFTTEDFYYKRNLVTFPKIRP